MEHPGRETRTTTTPETPKARRNKIRIRSEVDRWIQAKELGISRQCAYRWRRRYRSEGAAGLTPSAYSGGRRGLSVSGPVVARLVAEFSSDRHWPMG
ncbi:helix-turn-helix domain-containing protein [Cryobacterium roopkundense]|uniref:helix-turn-helix domain-containing protein n=1 Tax=Cryobacterium roopkundense TaxID=1001240 RepID=UPI001C84BA25